MMTSYLPADLEEEILSRVPATSLMRWRSICRRWNTLFFEDQRFSEKHFRNAPKQPLVLMLTEYTLQENSSILREKIVGMSSE
ncbi:hypothetical protein DY000_02063678 [Brassica cretica]|uniref:F-box domain-containing protein n=2 Tax=Brassica TaxID=3705 RepID=A0A0D3CZZ2_BRAOL|nr:hypothetical protein DY000_02063678 [Brassica cretica]